MSKVSESIPFSHPIRVSDLPTKKPTTFTLRPDARAMAAIAANLGLLGLKKLRFEGELSPVGRKDWQLQARIGATVVQPCVVTLDPVTTRIEEPITRVYLSDMAEIEPGSEIEMPDDETAEPLPVEIDVADVMIEALALYLPLYPRAEGAELDEAVFTEPGKQAMKDEDARPFAGLKALRDKLGKDDG